MLDFLKPQLLKNLVRITPQGIFILLSHFKFFAGKKNTLNDALWASSFIVTRPAYLVLHLSIS